MVLTHKGISEGPEEELSEDLDNQRVLGLFYHPGSTFHKREAQVPRP